MKHKQARAPRPLVSGPPLKQLVEREKAESKQRMQAVSVRSAPQPAPALYQDAGGGYNRNFTFPQE
jgi:hypothetical protein